MDCSKGFGIKSHKDSMFLKFQRMTIVCLAVLVRQSLEVIIFRVEAILFGIEHFNFQIG